MRSVYVGLALAATFLGASCVNARPVRVWKDAELWSEAEVVVLAMPRATKDVVARADDPRPDYWVDVETTLEVQVVLKGEAGGEVTLRHARYRDGTMPLPNGPMFVKLDPERRQQFLLFLKRAKDGTLEPLSGQMDAHDSVRWVQPFGAIR